MWKKEIDYHSFICLNKLTCFMNVAVLILHNVMYFILTLMDNRILTSPPLPPPPTIVDFEAVVED